MKHEAMVGNGIVFRSANKTDRSSIFRLRNDPEAIAMSISGSEVSWDEHCKWFEDKISGEETRFIVAEHNVAGVIGVSRFDLPDTCEYCLVSISVDGNFRGQGIGLSLLSRGIEMIERQFVGMTFLADVKSCNAASIALFHRLKFSDHALMEDGVIRLALSTVNGGES